MPQLSPCSHEEADTRIFVHYVDDANKGHKNIMIRTVDTDVVVLAIASYFLLAVDELWIAFGTGNNFRYLAAHQYASTLGPTRALPMFHVITGCDTVSSFAGRGKKTAWDVRMSHNEATGAFPHLTASPDEIIDHHLAVLERFVVLLYDCDNGLDKVNMIYH